MNEPPLVARALALERELGFERSSIPEVGRLLHLLAAQRGRTRVGDLTPGLGPDLVREFWLNHPEIVGLEVLTTPEAAAILGTRRG